MNRLLIVSACSLAVVLIQHASAQSVALADAIKAKDLSQVRTIVEQGTAVNERDRSGLMPLHHAAIEGSPEIIRFLIERGANIEAKGEPGYTPLIYAVDKGAIDRVRALLVLGADVNRTVDDGFVALHWAAFRGYPDVVEQLVRSGANVLLEGKGLSPLDGALLNDKMTVANLLARSHSSLFVAAKDISFSTPFLAAFAEQQEWVGVLHTRLDFGTYVPLRSGLERGGRIASFRGLLKLRQKGLSSGAVLRVHGGFEVPVNGAALAKAGAVVAIHLETNKKARAELAAAGLRPYEPK